MTEVTRQSTQLNKAQPEVQNVPPEGQPSSPSRSDEETDVFSSIISMPDNQFPRVVYALLGSMLLEHLCESGLKSLMTLYFQVMLELEDDQVTRVLHSFYFLKYFAVLIGAILSDSYFGKIKIIYFSSLTYVGGTVLLTMTSLIKRSFPSRLVLCLAMISKVVGLGGLLPCLIPLAAEQFKGPESVENIRQLFIIYFVGIQLAEVFSTFLLPVIKETSCLGSQTCYPLAFGIPSLFAVASFVLFASVSKKCLSLQPHQPVIIQGLECIYYALRMKITKGKEMKKNHWLDYAEDRYDANFIQDTKQTLDVLFIPIPVYWSLYDQQATTWTLQASRMDCEIGSLRVQPAQVQVMCPLLFFIFVPLFHFIIYDMLFNKNILQTVLHRMIVGGFLIALAFFMSAMLEFAIETTYPTFPPRGKALLNVFNGINYTLQMKWIDIDYQDDQIKESLPFTHSKFFIRAEGKDILTIKAVCVENGKTKQFPIIVQEKESVSYSVVNGTSFEFIRIGKLDTLKKDRHGDVLVRLICTDRALCEGLIVSLYSIDWPLLPRIAKVSNISSGNFFKDLASGMYKAYLSYKQEQRKSRIRLLLDANLHLRTGGVYTLMIYHDQTMKFKLFEITPPNSISVLWMIPQYVVLSISGVMFTISAYSFIYMETPDNVKSFAWSICYMTLSTGNMITAFIGGHPMKPALNFLLFFFIMLAGMFFFINSASKYKYKRLTPTRRLFPD